jgi:predicted amidohydrolase YtcJ
MLIRNAEIMGGGIGDLRTAGGKIIEIGRELSAAPNEDSIEAGGNALLPGLHDHHIHFLAFAASFSSVRCGPPQVTTADELVRALRAASEGLDGWIRGIGYHESVAGDIDRTWLDRAVLDRPVRVQHRGGRLWVLNSLGLELLNTPSPNDDLKFGKLYDSDAWLRQRLGNTPPPLGPASQYLASRGVTGFTDATPTNSADELDIFRAAIESGDLLQSVLMMGSDALEDTAMRGATKIHLREAVLPPLDETAARIAHSHAATWPVAMHCVTLAELMFTLAAFQDAGTIAGDRIEHAGVTPADAIPLIAEMGLTVVTQPNFIAERGDAYLRDVDPADHAALYRLRAFLDAGIPLGGGTDAPFGGADPWAAMAAAVSRRSASGHVIGAGEALTPEQALALFLGHPQSPGGPARTIRTGADADLCLIDRPWDEARQDLGAVGVTTTFKSGQIVWRR